MRLKRMQQGDEYTHITILITDIDADLTNDMYLNYHRAGFMYDVLMKHREMWEE